jgi:hypothetical protein
MWRRRIGTIRYEEGRRDKFVRHLAEKYTMAGK